MLCVSCKVAGWNSHIRGVSAHLLPLKMCARLLPHKMCARAGMADTFSF